jgi:hypothetical protein
MDKSVSNGVEVPQRKFLYKLWNKAFDVEGREEWATGKHEILNKTATVIYIHSVPYLGEEFEWKREKRSFEVSRKEIEQLGRSWVPLMRTTFYPSEAAAWAAIPRRVQLKPVQAVYFGFSNSVTRRELDVVYWQLAYDLDPIMGGSTDAFSELKNHYQTALQTIGQ